MKPGVVLPAAAATPSPPPAIIIEGGRPVEYMSGAKVGAVLRPAPRSLTRQLIPIAHRSARADDLGSAIGLPVLARWSV